MIEIRRRDEGAVLGFDVVVRDGKGETKHRVTMAPGLFDRLASGERTDKAGASRRRATPEEVIDAAFRFLLEREPKESILSRFDVSVISRYFPEFERELPRYLPSP
jgi:hypothetical protein